jgi:putative transcriptional regulator
MEAYKSIVKGLEEAIEYERGKLKGVKVNRIYINEVPAYIGKQIKDIRTKNNLTQMAFSKVLGVSKKTVEAWESGKNVPSGPAQRMMEVMSKDSEFLEKYSIVNR